MNNTPLMKCGHAANSRRTSDGKQVCVICYGRPEAQQEAPAPDLTGRQARCTYDKGHPSCREIRRNVATDRLIKSVTESSTDLPFFQHRPDKEYDAYYNGCWGWN